MRVPRDPTLRELIRAHLDSLRGTEGEADELWDELDRAEKEQERLEDQVTQHETILKLRAENDGLKLAVQRQAREMGVIQPTVTAVDDEVEPQSQVETWRT